MWQSLQTRVQPAVTALQQRTVGRVGLKTVEDLQRVEIFDRAMTLSAQVFTSVFPIIIMFGVVAGQWLPLGTESDLTVPQDTKDLLSDALRSTDPGSFGLAGGLLVIISATSLSRAMARMYSAVWQLPRPRSGVSAWWRWVAVVLAFALSLLVVRQLDHLSQGLVAAQLWGFVSSAVAYTVILVLVAVVLVQGALPTRWVLPGALIGGLGLGISSRVGGIYLPHALDTGEERFGSIGVAFTYLGYLYVMSFVLILATIVGAVMVRDDGPMGEWLRGSVPGPSVWPVADQPEASLDPSESAVTDRGSSGGGDADAGH